MQVQGKIKIIGEVQTFGDNGFRKAELILDVTQNPEYPQFVNIDFTQDKTDLLNSYKVGQSVDVYINLGGREWINPQGEAKYFNSVTGWRIEDLTPVEPSQPIEAPNLIQGVEDDLPF
jgi:hypothetical protein